MNPNQLRNILADALDYALRLTEDELKQLENFRKDEGDISLEHMDLDSLGVMEFCINIELNTGIPFLPDQLGSINSMKKLTEVLLCEINHSSSTSA